MTTRTITEIVAKMVATIEGLTPEAEPAARRFRYNLAPSRPLRPWLPDAGGNDMFRRFDVDTGARSDLGANLIAAVHVTIPVVVTVVYPANPNLFGLKERFELEALIASDAAQIKDALRAPTGLAGSGHVANLVTEIAAIDRSDERAFYQPIEVQTVFFNRQRG